MASSEGQLGQVSTVIRGSLYPMWKLLPDDHAGILEGSFSSALSSHRFKPRNSGELFILHPVRVADMLMMAGVRDVKTVGAAYLHDVAEDTDRIARAEIPGRRQADVFDRIRSIIDPEVAQIVFFMTEFKHEPEFEYPSMLEVAVKEEPRAVLAKIADRCDNIETLASMPDEKQFKKVWETELIYIPIFLQVAGKFPEETKILMGWLDNAIKRWKAVWEYRRWNENPQLPPYLSPTHMQKLQDRRERVTAFNEYHRSMVGTAQDYVPLLRV